MDKLPDNMEKDDSIMAQQNKPEAPKKACRKHLWAWIACGVALLAALGATLSAAAFPSEASKGNVDLAIERPGLTPSPAVSPSVTDEENGDPESADIRPLLYKDGADIYLASGAESIKLDSTSSEGSYFFRGEVSANGNTLYYLTNFNSSYEGDLMRIKLGAENAGPELIAEGVYSAQVSPDDEKILIVTGGGYGLIGNLYISTPGGEPILIAESVAGLDYGFSADGRYVYYHTYNYKDYSNTLYIYSEGKSKEIYKNTDSEGFKAYIDEDGRAIIMVGEFGFVKELDYTVFLYEGGEVRLAAEHATYVRSLSRADKFLYVTPDNELVFYNRGREQVISDKGSGLQFTRDMWSKTMDSERFVFTEGGEDPNKAVLYEFTVQDGKVMIDNSGRNYYPDADFSRVAYSKEGSLYVAVKSDGKWIGTKVSEHGGGPAFDGSYIYYLNNLGNTWKDNTLYRMSLSTGKEEKLFVGVERFLPWNDKCFAVSVDGNIYCIKSENESVLIIEDVPKAESIGLHTAGFIMTGDGVYVFTYEDGRYPVFKDIYYISGGGFERICGNVEYLECMGLMPLIVY